MRRDLFGNPVPPNWGQKGRPRFMPTAADRRLVRRLHREGLSQLDIAAALGITGPTLRLNFRAELQSNSQTGARRARRDRKEKR